MRRAVSQTGTGESKSAAISWWTRLLTKAEPGRASCFRPETRFFLNIKVNCTNEFVPCVQHSHTLG